MIGICRDIPTRIHKYSKAAFVSTFRLRISRLKITYINIVLIIYQNGYS
jgi:hypothetical protein